MMVRKSKLLRKLIRGEQLNISEASLLGDTSEIDFCFPIKYVIRGDKFLGSPTYSDSRQNIAPICLTRENLVAKTANSFGSLLEEHEKIKFGMEKGVPLVESRGFCNIYNTKIPDVRYRIVSYCHEDRFYYHSCLVGGPFTANTFKCKADKLY